MKKNPHLLQQFLLKQQAKHRYRRPRLSESAQQPLMTIEGKQVLSFCSNDYLGLANHPKLIEAFQQAAKHYGVGSGAAHLINGHNIEHQLLEEAIAEFTGRQRALLFSTGYMANLGVIAAMTETGETIFQDRLNHASLIDAGRLSDASMRRYLHNDLDNLAQRLARTEASSMVISDGVFSMDGDCANLAGLASLAQDHQCWLMIDDAHGFGVLGETGAGLAEAAGLSSQQVPILMATLGKAAGTAGAFVAGDHDFIEYLIQSARTYVFTTAMPPALAAAGRMSLRLIQEEPWRREQLRQNIRQFKQGVTSLGLPVMPSDTAIQPIMLGSSQMALNWSEQLWEQGILVTAIRPPTVPNNKARLRVTLSAAHTPSQIDQLLETLAQLTTQSVS
ncbi:MAG: 8-amino-7-oxononanoate synthase [Leucothrix sp.]